jgi:hypothetical protein
MSASAVAQRLVRRLEAGDDPARGDRCRECGKHSATLVCWRCLAEEDQRRKEYDQDQHPRRGEM